MRILSVLTLSLLFSMFVPLSVAGGETDKSFDSQYKLWSQLSSEELMKMGDRFWQNDNQADSALLSFSIVANRYFEKHHDKKDIECCIEAMDRIGQLYSEEFYDFQNAETYFLQAEEIAKKHKYESYLPAILLDLTNMKTLKLEVFEDSLYYPEILNDYRNVFNLAKDNKSWTLLCIIFNNMMFRTTLQGRDTLIQKEKQFVSELKCKEDTNKYVVYAKDYINVVDLFRNPDSSKDTIFTFLQKLIKDAELLDNPKHAYQGEIFARYHLCKWYDKEEMPDKVIEELFVIKQLAEEHKDMVYSLDAYFNLYRYLNFIDRNDQSAEYYIKYLEKKDSLVTKSRLSDVDAIRFLFELNKKNEEVRALARERGLHRMIICLTLALIAALTVTLLLLFRRYMQTERHNRQLYLKTLELLKADEEKRELIEQQVPKKYEHSSLDETAKSELLHRIFVVMETSEEIYSDGFTLNKLAELVGEKRNNVSQAINEKYNMDFNALLREYRIKEACRRMNDMEDYGNYTIEAIAQSVGFKSRSNFGAAFKSVTGLTPSVYLRMAKKH